jgi:hypothetical protein
VRYQQPGQVWSARVDPWRLYCHDNGRDESEYVINTIGLTIYTAASP